MNERRQQHYFLERQVLRLYQLHGLGGAVALVTAISITTSVAITLAVCWPLYAESNESPNGLLIALGLAVVVPSICAPIATLVLVRLMQRLEEAVQAATQLATTDVLTGVANRRGFFQSIELLGTNTANTQLCLVGILDCDSFKQINDSFGHSAGDAALIEIARRLSSVVGEEGCIGRLGGDEFGFVVVAGEDAVRRKQQEIKERCERLAIDLPDSSQAIILHSSIGTALQSSGESVEEALTRADQQLYSSKRANREQSIRAATRSA
ncbi:GGDEF domain-containing protein [Congregibacter sp.]|uniref:GGDEF domain-containing protein n=1 Tax=Congregibacter sp. TaxID=2744308 RepID=UPI00385E48F8